MEMLGDLFGVSPTTISNICKTWWRFLSQQLKCLIYNPPKWVVMKNRPPGFEHPSYKGTRHIIDCTETFIQTPKKPDLAAAMWSDYKKHYTVKYLLSCLPIGSFNYVSKGWSGRTSDNHITEHSGFTNILEPMDKVLADKGFQVQKLMGQFATEMVRFHFLTLII